MKTIAEAEVIVEDGILMVPYNPLSFKETFAKDMFEKRGGNNMVVPSGSYRIKVRMGRRGLSVYLHQTSR